VFHRPADITTGPTCVVDFCHSLASFTVSSFALE
jgi:hypothetical protein